MDTPPTWQQRQEALENTVIQLAEIVRMLAQAQARVIQDPPILPQMIRPQLEERPPLVEEVIGDNYPHLNRNSPEWERSRRSQAQRSPDPDSTVEELFQRVLQLEV